MIGRLAKPWPGPHHALGAHPTARHYAASSGITPGSLVEVSGPYPPQWGWTCGTPVEWRLTDSRIPLNNVAMCVHQISFEPSAIETETAVTSDQLQAVSL